VVAVGELGVAAGGTHRVGDEAAKPQQSPWGHRATSGGVTPALTPAASTPGFLPPLQLFMVFAYFFSGWFLLFQKYCGNFLVLLNLADGLHSSLLGLLGAKYPSDSFGHSVCTHIFIFAGIVV